MNDIYFESGSICNFCFDHTENEGITWDVGKMIKPNPWSDPVKAYYHVCDKCAMLFRKRQVGMFKSLDAHGEYKKIKEENDRFASMRIDMARQFRRDQDTSFRKKHKEKYVIVPELIKQFSDEEEDLLAAYGYVIKSEKAESKRIKGQQTYIKNRLYDEKTVENLVKFGCVNTAYQGVIDLDDIVGWYVWDEKEKERIDEIVKMRDKARKEWREKMKKQNSEKTD